MSQVQEASEQRLDTVVRPSFSWLSFASNCKFEPLPSVLIAGAVTSVLIAGAR